MGFDFNFPDHGQNLRLFKVNKIKLSIVDRSKVGLFDFPSFSRFRSPSVPNIQYTLSFC